MKPLRRILAFFAVVALASALRFPALATRPMHCDEAVHADKFGTLLEGGGYVYNPSEYHGPTLYYLTLLPARLQGATRYIDIDETTLRSVPAAFGVALVAAHALLVPYIGLGGAAAAAFLTAVSPAMVFYSRYYIHEVLLVFFSFGVLIAGCGYARKPGAVRAVLAGVCLALMQATKETAPIALGAMLAAMLLVPLIERRIGDPSPAGTARARVKHILLSLAAAAAVSAALFSSFSGNPRGIVDSIRAYGIYLDRVSTITWHFHPWDYYLRLLLHFPSKGTPVWSEGLIVALGAVGMAAAWRRNGVPGLDAKVLRFLSLYTLVLVFVYSAIPYKTPWCLLGFLHGLILLAAAGAVCLWKLLRGSAGRVILSLFLLAGASHLGWQAWAGSFRFDSDPRNPYVYAHTGEDVHLIARRIEKLAQAAPLGLATPVDIISRENLWPMPWYLRRLTALRWWNGVSESVPTAPIILASPDMEDALIRKLYETPPPGERELFMHLYERHVELRPQVELRGYAAKSLWDSYLRREAEEGAAAPTGSGR